MPDMSKPLAHLETLKDNFRFHAQKLRRESATLITRAEVYEDAARDAEDALDAEQAKSSGNGTEGGSK